MSKIEWTEKTWNPVSGCNKVSPGCKYCYAETMSKRLKAMRTPGYEEGFKLTLQPERLQLPKSWRKPKTIFVNSMSDLFHTEIPFNYLEEVFAVMRDCPQHTFQVLTKRAEYLAQVADKLTWTSNIWMGVSVENDQYLTRIEQLRSVPAAVRFLSLEPLLGPLPNLNLDGIDWVIVGGESGRSARPIDPAWVEDLRDQCAAASVAFFFKQWGGKDKKAAGRLLSGRVHDSRPQPKLPLVN